MQDSVENIRSAGYLNGKPAIPLIIFRQPGANIIDTVDPVKAALPSLKASIPSAMNMQIVLDRTTTIRASVHEVERTLMIAIMLVILVVFLFLRNGRATLIPAVVVPVVTHWHFWRDVSVRLQSRQSFLDGADYLDWVRGR